MLSHTLPDGLVINGSFPDPEVIDAIKNYSPTFPLIVADPPYGNIVDEEFDRIKSTDVEFCDWMINWTKTLEELSVEGGAYYCWGGIGKPNFRPFYRYLPEVETKTNFKMKNHITWSKRRAYGVNNDYLFTREELAYFVLGDPKKPRLFNIPLLEKERGYEGYNKKYPAKSKFLRRTNVWSDITEIFKGKVHINQKPERVIEIPIEVHTNPGEIVLDPFAGSGTTGRAARNLGRRFVLVEKEEKDFHKIVESLK